MDDLPEQLKPTYGIKIKLSSGSDAVLPVCGPLFKKWNRRVKFDFGGKPLVNFEGKPIFVELAILKMLERSGWSGVWVETYGGVHYLKEMPSGWKTGEKGVAIPKDKEELLRRIRSEAKTKSCFDVFVWREDEILFVEAKQFEKDKLRETQYKFIEAAIKCGVQPDSLMVAEWDFKKRKPETNMRVIFTESDASPEEKKRRTEWVYDFIFNETVKYRKEESVFKLMLEKLRSISVGNNFMNEINRLRKEAGIDKATPDETMLRIFHRLGLIYSETASPDNINDVIKILYYMTKATGEGYGVVETVMRTYGGGNGFVSKAICSKEKPLCDQCPIAGYCHAGFLDPVRRREIAQQCGPHTILDAPQEDLFY